jgi:hypothetical protein
MMPTTENTPATAPVLWKKLVGADRVFDWEPESVGVEAGSVTTEVCVKTWPSDVWTTKERLEVKETFEAEEEEEVFAGVGDEDVAPAGLDAAALEGVLEGELAAGVEELDGAAVDCGVVVCATCEVGVGVGLEVAGAGAELASAVVAGVVTGA